MLHTIIEKNTYMDSVELMKLSKELSHFSGIEKATVMMGTAANKEIMEKGGFGSEKLTAAKANDMVIAVDAENEDAVKSVLRAVKEAAEGRNKAASGAAGQTVIKSWEAAKDLGGDYNVCLISVPGEYAAAEAMEALNQGRHVMLFSDNVSLEDELALKKAAHAKGLLVMGPDCGTSILGGVSLAFANSVRRGNIGIAGASGTGIQELSVMIDRLGGGISHAIGTGGRDLSGKIGAITMKDAVGALEDDSATDVIAVISKPPAPSVRDELLGVLAGLTKPCAVLFLGEKAREGTGGVRLAGTMEGLARTAVELAGGTPRDLGGDGDGLKALPGAKLIGLFTGGTLAYEAAYLAKEAMGIKEESVHEMGYILRSENGEIIDLGDDVYTKGKPHPMMDPSSRNEKMKEILAGLDRPAVVLLDVVLGYGSAKDPAAELAGAIEELQKVRGDRTAFVVNLLGTEGDPQNLFHSKAVLEKAGAHVYLGNSRAVKAALEIAGYALPDAPLKAAKLPGAIKCAGASNAAKELLQRTPAVINVGLKGFADDLEKQGVRSVHFEWRPVAGGDKTLLKALNFLGHYEFKDGPYRNIDEANEAVIDKVRGSLPCLVDVIPACEASDVFGHGKLLLHAGPPIEWQEMTHPMQGSCVGAALFEEWAATEEEAWALFERGEVAFMPCHHAGFVGPMGGITSAHMPVLKVTNVTGGNDAYCTMNEGIGQVLRFGAYGPAVVDRLRFMRDTLGPVLAKAVKTVEGGLNLNVMIGRAIAMGDEFHQRNIAASLVFLKEVAPIIVGLDIPTEDKRKVIQFLANTDQFFLNVMMATGKAVMDYAATVEYGTVVTVMSRNGKDFGIRVSGMGNEWFTGPVNTPKGLYFTGFSEEDANPDIGDSAITETFGVGGMAMIAAPAVTRFVGSGGFYDALETSNRMCEITIANNGMFPIPTWDFKGTCLGIDIRKVAATGITPVINTGIAHKIAGLGQIGAGTVNPPLECFTKAVLAYAEKLGFNPN
ncbi:bifunctional FdrA/YlbE family protein [Gehongia tenuis]|uniref:Acyl-CoA synthetase FdrA n=1 Tax=Gehongia tenuis TaxID=2763655 RepID=A0A926D3Y7_9FIRM|nr:acyl-CoA synthetase FdrA [Gehongia tenuis]